MRRTMSDELVINGENFNQYFFEVNLHSPKPEQIMARYCAKAALIESEEKGYLIDMLTTNPKGAEMGVQMARKMFGAKEDDAVALCKEIVSDLLRGKDRDEVLKKRYPFTFEKFFWTKEEYVPKNDPHWKAIKITIATGFKDEEKTEDGE
jgi:hypothetical protein